MIMKVDRRFHTWWKKNTVEGEFIGLNHWVAFEEENTLKECKFESH